VLVDACRRATVFATLLLGTLLLQAGCGGEDDDTHAVGATGGAVVNDGAGTTGGVTPTSGRTGGTLPAGGGGSGGTLTTGASGSAGDLATGGAGTGAVSTGGNPGRTSAEIVRDMGLGWNLGNTLDSVSSNVNDDVDETFWGTHQPHRSCSSP
jgi:hypothetical protein